MADKKGVILLSGGLDSAVVLAIMIDRGYIPYPISINYRQQSQVELLSAKAQVDFHKLQTYKVIDIALDKIGGSSLVDSDFDSNGDLKSEIPPTYQPARNTIFLSIALAYAETLKVDEIFIGTNTLDYSGYPDCRTEYIKAYEKLANLATKRATEDNKKIQIQTPLALMDKKEIILEGDRLGVDFKLTNSCYFPLKFGIPCGDCDSCHIRAKGFKLAMLIDPLIKED